MEVYGRLGMSVVLWCVEKKVFEHESSQVGTRVEFDFYRKQGAIDILKSHMTVHCFTVYLSAG